MARSDAQHRREDALRRAADHSAFLRESLHAHPEIGDAFKKSGAESAVAAALSLETGEIEVQLRRQRHALALAVALGDLSGEMPLERVTEILSDFADRAIDEAIIQAIVECVPDADPQGFACAGPPNFGMSLIPVVE